MATPDITPMRRSRYGDTDAWSIDSPEVTELRRSIRDARGPGPAFTGTLVVLAGCTLLYSGLAYSETGSHAALMRSIAVIAACMCSVGAAAWISEYRSNRRLARFERLATVRHEQVMTALADLVTAVRDDGDEATRLMLTRSQEVLDNSGGGSVTHMSSRARPSS